MTKVIIALLSCLLYSLLLAETEMINGIEWTYTISNGEAIIGGGNKSQPAIPSTTSGEITLPMMLGGSPVTAVANYAFSGCNGLTSVTIPSNIILLGRYAFQNCTELKSVVISDNITVIGGAVFAGCSSLTSIKFPANLKTIGDYAFYECISLKSISIPEGVISIGCDTFANCTSLTTVTLPTSVMVIGASAFRECDSLTTVALPLSVTQIGDGAFFNCNKLTSIVIPSSVTKIGDCVFGGCAALNSVVFNGLTPPSVGVSAFPRTNGYYFSRYSSTWQSIISEGGVWNGLLMKMNKVDGVQITFDSNGGEGGTVVTQERGAQLTVPIVTRVDYTFIGWSPDVPKKVPDSDTTYIAQWQANQCKITFDANGGEGSQTFTQAYGTELIAPTVTREGYTFVGWSPSVPATVPVADKIYVAQWQANQYTIAYSANGGSGTMWQTSATYGESITLPNATFVKEGFYFRGWATEVEGRIIYPDGATVSNLTTEQNGVVNLFAVWGSSNATPEEFFVYSHWHDTNTGRDVVNIKGLQGMYPEDIIVPTTIEGVPVSHIGFGQFEVYEQLKSITFPDADISIFGFTDECLPNLESVFFKGCHYSMGVSWFPETAIGYYPARYAEEWLSDIESFGEGDGRLFNLKMQLWEDEVVTPEDITLSLLNFSIINDGVVITGLKKANYSGALIIPEKLKGYPVPSIGSNAFYNCSGLTSVTIPSSVTSIGSNAFSGCTGLTSVTIPSSVTTIGSNAFSGVAPETLMAKRGDIGSISTENLKTLIIPEGVTEIGEYAFYGCSSLTSVMIPSSVTSIGDDAFYGCSSLTSVTIPEGVTFIGCYAFYGCDNLYKDTNGVQYESEARKILVKAPRTFSGTFVTPESVRFIHGDAFRGCSNLTSILIPQGVVSIGGYAFEGCSLTSVTIPSSVTIIDYCAFNWCPGLTSVTFEGAPPQDCYGFNVGPTGYYFAQYASEWEEVIAADGTWNGLTMRCMEAGKLFTLTFDANGGEGGQTLTQAYGTTFIAPTVTREGYAFVGWYPTVPSKIPAQDVTYTAQWKINQYTITFDAVGGEGGTSVTQDYGSSLTAPTVTREGYTFIGWSPTVPVTVPAMNVTYMAQWRANQYTQTFDAAGGEGGASVTQDYAASLIAPTVTREGYTFVGWLPEVPSITPAVNAIYVAQWAKVYEVRVNCKGDGTVSGVGFYQSGASIVLTATPDEGVTFCGWAGFKKTAETTISFVMPEEDVVLSAYFAKSSALDAYLSTHENSGGDADDLDSLVEAEIAKRDLHTADEMKEMVVDTPVIETKNGVVTIRLQVKDGAANEIMDGGEVSVEITPKAGEKAGFYKFVVPNKQ